MFCFMHEIYDLCIHACKTCNCSGYLILHIEIRSHIMLLWPVIAALLKSLPPKECSLKYWLYYVLFYARDLWFMHTRMQKLTCNCSGYLILHYVEIRSHIKLLWPVIAALLKSLPPKDCTLKYWLLYIVLFMCTFADFTVGEHARKLKMLPQLLKEFQESEVTSSIAC